jgi:hypothetical protein
MRRGTPEAVQYSVARLCPQAARMASNARAESVTMIASSGHRLRSSVCRARCQARRRAAARSPRGGPLPSTVTLTRSAGRTRRAMASHSLRCSRWGTGRSAAEPGTRSSYRATPSTACAPATASRIAAASEVSAVVCPYGAATGSGSAVTGTAPGCRANMVSTSRLLTGPGAHSTTRRSANRPWLISPSATAARSASRRGVSRPPVTLTGSRASRLPVRCSRVKSSAVMSSGTRTRRAAAQARPPAPGFGISLPPPTGRTGPIPRQDGITWAATMDDRWVGRDAPEQEQDDTDSEDSRVPERHVHVSQEAQRPLTGCPRSWR